MKQKCVILRGNRMLARDVFRGAFANQMDVMFPRGEVSVEVAELHRNDIPSVTRDADVLAIAPAMPMSLIEPYVTPQDAIPVGGATLAWGVKAVKANTSPYTGKDIVVAVLDTGIDASHAAFDGVELVQRDFTGDNGTAKDTDGHGTHCAGTIFGRAVDGMRIGVAPGVKRALIGKVLGGGRGGSTERIASAIQWAAENGAHVISMSLGLDFPSYQQQLMDMGYPPPIATSRALEGYRANVMLFERLASFIRARAHPTVMIAAAGNESQRKVDPRFEISVSPPAVSEGMISVAALGERDGGLEVADFSNTGANVSGPGVGIDSAKLGGGLVKMSGTSMATPHVAGVAALWAEAIVKVAPLSVMALTAKLVGSATFEGMGEGFDPFDAGAGLVIAPQA